MRVLLVEDDQMIGKALKLSLKEAAYAVDWACDGQMATNAIETQAYDLILLDLGLPIKDGIDVLCWIREQINPVSLLIVTARDSVDDRIRGLDLGADDYIVKPFEMSELLARMRAVMRRKGGFGSPMLSNGVLSLDPVSREAKFEGATTRLSAREFSLLHALLIRPGAILSRQELEGRIYGWNEEVESNAVEFLIYSIRKKLGINSIRNIRGVGWMVSKEK